MGHFCSQGLSHHYEANLVRLIKQLRIQYSSPNAKFVTASLGQTKQGDTSNGGLILDAMVFFDLGLILTIFLN